MEINLPVIGHFDVSKFFDLHHKRAQGVLLIVVGGASLVFGFDGPMTDVANTFLGTSYESIGTTIRNVGFAWANIGALMARGEVGETPK